MHVKRDRARCGATTLVYEDDDSPAGRQRDAAVGAAAAAAALAVVTRSGAVHVKRDRDNDTGRCAVRSWHEQVRKPWAMSPMCFFFGTSAHVVCEGRLYGFQRRTALNGVKNAVECVVQAGNDDSCCTRSKQFAVLRRR